MKGRCGHNESELQVFWVDRAYSLKMLFVKVTARRARPRGAAGWVLGLGVGRGRPQVSPPRLVGAVNASLPPSLAMQESHNTSKGPEATWRLSKVQFVYDSSEKTHFKDAVSGE